MGSIGNNGGGEKKMSDTERMTEELPDAVEVRSYEEEWK